MKIGLIDVDGHNYPNIPLMKISAYHKMLGDQVEWVNPIEWTKHYDKVYMSKVFSFTPDYQYFVNADEIHRGGTGYAISLVDGREVFDKSKDKNLPEEIEHMYPDYSIYPEQTRNRAYGQLTRGCPRGCDFCIVKSKEGLCSKKVRDLSEFWNGQHYIELLDPNILACKDWEDLLGQVIESKSRVNFNQGLDIRMMTDVKAEMLSKIPAEKIHFAWDRIEDKEMIQPKFRAFREVSTIRAADLQVYVLVGDREKKVLDSDLERIYWLRDNGFYPYIMIYDKANLPKGHELLKLQRWVNNRFIFYKCKTFEEYIHK